MNPTIYELIKKRTVLLDGGFGTELMKHGFTLGTCPESWNVENPKVVKQIHRNYYLAGADAVLTNSFGGNKIKMSAYGLENKCYELNLAAAKIANEVKPKGRFLGGSMGPTGKFLKPQGEYEEAEFEDAFAEQAQGLADGQVDFLLIETQYDLREALCALRGARKASSLPVFVTMTFTRTPKGFFTMMGNGVSPCLKELERQGVPVVGSNCTLNSEEMTELVGMMRGLTALPIIAQANAGKPSLSSEGEVTYSQGLENYVRFIPQMIKNGASLVGGCCGTNPDYIRRMAQIIRPS